MFELKMTEEMKREVVQQATGQLVKAVMMEFNVKQVAAEVKNAVIKQAAKDLSAKFDQAYKVNEVVERAVQSAESRVQQKVTQLLSKGISISFSEAGDV